MSVERSELELLRCPAEAARGLCGGALRDEASELACEACGERWPVRDGVPRLYRESLVRGNDKLLRFFYDRFAELHDPAVKWLIPLFQTEGSERALREAYLRRLDLQSLGSRPDGRRVRILEVGAGTGANIEMVRDALPRGLAVEYWAMDLSEGMLTSLRARLTRHPEAVPGGGRVRLVMADAHALPYADGSFDRVFHTGGIGGYRDPARALAGMARVAVQGTPIVVVDEQLDPSRSHTLYHRAMFSAVTLYDRDTRSHVEQVPAGAVDVIDEQASRFFYCLSFKMPA